MRSGERGSRNVLHGRVEAARSVCGPGDVAIPGGVEHEGSFREDTEVIDFFARKQDPLGRISLSQTN